MEEANESMHHMMHLLANLDKTRRMQTRLQMQETLPFPGVALTCFCTPFYKLPIPGGPKPAFSPRQFRHHPFRHRSFATGFFRHRVFPPPGLFAAGVSRVVTSILADHEIRALT